ncbi:hypothetical protein ACIHF5_26260, partial [Streptomyces leeuwenhoekii]|uniref:hypothetical protein n=1 Tax=Streptomyces leeuwenhoekii TaxID=1437453 RepID=UPI0037D74B54
MSLFVGMVMFVGLIPDDASAASGSSRVPDVKREPSVPGRDFAKKRPGIRNDAAVDWRPTAGTVTSQSFTTQVTGGGGQTGRTPLLSGSGAEKTAGVRTSPVRIRKAGTAGKRDGVRITGRAAKRAPAAPGSAVRVQVKDMATARKAGVQGLLLTAEPATGATAPAASGSVDVELDYSSFKDTYGGDWASRLRLVR